MKLRINESVEQKFTEEQMKYAAGQNYVAGMKAFDAFKSAGFDTEFQWGSLSKEARKLNDNMWDINDISISITIVNMIFKFRASLFNYFPQEFYPQFEWVFGGYEMTSSNITVKDAEKLVTATKLAYKLFDEISSQFDKIIKTVENWSE